MPNISPFNANLQSDVIDQLKSFCRGEMSAAATYERAIASGPFPTILDVLARCLESHQRRVRLLGDKIQAMGGNVPLSAGVWGALVTMLGDAANHVSEKMAVSVLEQGEDHGLRDYRNDLSKLDSTTQRFILEKILPEQVETHEMMSTLKHAID